MNMTGHPKEVLMRSCIQVRVLAVLSIVLFAIPSVAVASEDLASLSRVYTLTNLHPDEKNNRLYSVNYLQPGLIPVCSEVEIIKQGRKKFVFRLKKTGKTYSYLNHKQSAEPFEEHLTRFFGAACDQKKMDALGEKDKSGIRTGTVSLGMTKQGVIFALGYPPRLANPDPMSSVRWQYWTNRFNTKVIEFSDKGVVTAIIE